MNELFFSLTPINNLLKFAEIVEVESSYCDGIAVKLDEAKLYSCSCGCVISAFGCEVHLVVLFFFSLERIFLVVNHHP